MTQLEDTSSTFVKNSHLKIAYIILILSITLPILLSYSNIDSFIFQHIGIAEKCDILGYIVETDPIFHNRPPSIPGWYAFAVVISKICNISYDILPFLPIHLIPFILLFFSIFKYINENKIVCSLIILIMATFSHTLYFGIHEMGFVLFLLIILSTIFLYQSKSASTHSASFLITILSLISLNYVSYKATAYALLFLLSLLFIEYFEHYAMKSDHIATSNQNLRKNLMNTSLVCVIITLFFNKFIYNSAIPTARLHNEFIMGVYKIPLMFHKNLFDPLGIYGLYYNPPIFLSYIKVIRLALLGIVILLCVFYILRTFIQKNRKNLSLANKIFLALLFVGLSILCFYNSIGLFDAGTLTYAGFMALLLLYTDKDRLFGKYDTKKLVCVFIIILIAMNTVYQVTVYIHSDVPQRDDNYFNYIKPSAGWFISHGAETDLKLKTDVLTRGYFIKEIVKNTKVSNYPSVFYSDDILFITQNPTAYTPHENIMYAVNYKEKHFSIEQWRILKSLSYSRDEIESNQHLNMIYSSGSMSFCSPNL